MGNENYITILQKILKKTGWNQARLAQEIGVTFLSVNRWLNGHSQPHKTNLRTINRLYNTYVGIEPVSSQELEKLFQKVDQQQDYYGEIGKYLTKPEIVDAYLLELTYHSDAIEGSTLSKKETEAIIFDKATIRDKDLVEHLEAVNHSVILKDIFTRPVRTIEESWVLEIHRRLMQGIRQDGGQYAITQRAIRGVDLQLPHPDDIPEEMAGYFSRVNKQSGNGICYIAEMHAVFEAIHPFGDGNGRVGRLIMIAQLLAKGYAPCVIVKENRADYYEALEWAQKGETTHLQKFVIEAVLEGYKILAKLP